MADCRLSKLELEAIAVKLSKEAAVQGFAIAEAKLSKLCENASCCSSPS